MAHDNLLAADFSNEPYWWKDASPYEPEASSLPESTDALIIGSGYSGLCCAIELARAGMSVVVIDAQAIGEGASSRAAGFTAGRAGVSKQINLEKAVGPDRARAILEEADAAHDYLQSFIAAENIACDFEFNGRYVGAVNRRAYDKLAIKMAEYNADGQSRFEMIPQNEQHRYVDSRVYKGGMLIKNAGCIHPSKYHAGLVALCRQEGVTLVGRVRARSIEPATIGKRVLTTSGPIDARHVMLATGGYTDGVSHWHRKRIIPMSSTIMTTEEMEPGQVQALLPANAPVIDTRRVLCFARTSPDGKRLLFGGRASFSPLSTEKTVAVMHRKMLDVFPQLRGVKITNEWSGYMAFTFDFLPKTGVHDGVHYAMACNGGSGIVMMSWLGRKAAWNILGSANRASAFEADNFKTMPFYRETPWFLPLVGNWYRLRDWIDARYQ